MKLANIWLVAIIVIAACLRIYHLDVNPPAVYGDEISFAWNAWSVLKTGEDEYGIRYPLQFKAFNDYKAPLPVYLLVPIFKIWGMNALSLRMPVALMGTLTVGLTYLLAKQLFESPWLIQQRISSTKLGLITALLLAISPWHIHLSRGYFEATLALCLFVLAMYLFFKSLKRVNYIFLSSLCFGLTLYTYFTPRILLLLFLPFLYMCFRRQIKPYQSKYILALMLFILISLPLIKLAVFDRGSNRLVWFVNERLQQSAKEATEELRTAGGGIIIKKLWHNRYLVLFRRISNDYLEHFSINFWYIYGDNSLRYFLGKMGMFYVIELPMVLLAIFWLLTDQPKMAIFLFGWLMLASIPSAITGRPFAVRSLAMLPVPFLLVSFGINKCINFSHRLGHKQIPILIISLGLGVSLFYYLSRYHLDYPAYAATWWGWENKAAIDYARLKEQDYQQIFLSDFYTGMPLALAFYHQYDPVEYRQARDNPVIIEGDKRAIKLGKYYIGSLDIDETRAKKGVIPPKTLYIGRPEETDGQEAISAPDDGRVLFKIHYTN